MPLLPSRRVQFLLSLVAIFFPYIRSIRRGTFKPHVFSWVTWALGTLIVSAAQFAGGAGVGALPIGVSGLITGYVALLAYALRADTRVTRSDWAFFVAALAAIPLWLVTSDPLWAVVVLTLVDLLGFGPTIRRAWTAPHEDSPLFFTLGAVRNAFVLAALERLSLTTALFPAAVGLACAALAVLLVLRRGRRRET